MFKSAKIFRSETVSPSFLDLTYLNQDYIFRQGWTPGRVLKFFVRVPGWAPGFVLKFSGSWNPARAHPCFQIFPEINWLELSC